MAWCRQATSHYLNQCWPRSLPPYGVIRPQWVNIAAIEMKHRYCGRGIISHNTDHITPGHKHSIAKTIGSISIRHRSDTFASDWYLINRSLLSRIAQSLSLHNLSTNVITDVHCSVHFLNSNDKPFNNGLFTSKNYNAIALFQIHMYSNFQGFSYGILLRICLACTNFICKLKG